MQIGKQRQSLRHACQIRDFLRGESANAVGGVRHRVVGAERGLDRQCKMFGRSFCLNIMEDLEIELVIGDIDARRSVSPPKPTFHTGLFSWPSNSSTSWATRVCTV